MKKLCIIFALMLFLQGRIVAKQWEQANTPVSYGMVHNSPLSYLAADNLTATYTMLEKRRFREVAGIFEAEAKRNPKNLTAYVAWLQSKPEVIAPEIKRLEAQPPRDSVSLFKLGTLKVYRWMSQTNSQIHAMIVQKKEVQADINVGKSLLLKAWSENPEPVIGLMLVETCYYLSDVQTGRKVLYALIQKTAGDEAYALFVKAERGKWYDNPPSPRLTSEANRKPLGAVLMNLWTEANVKSRQGRVVNGQAVWDDWKEPSPDNKRKANYVDTWIKRLKNSQVANR